MIARAPLDDPSGKRSPAERRAPRTPTTIELALLDEKPLSGARHRGIPIFMLTLSIALIWALLSSRFCERCYEALVFQLADRAALRFK